MLKFDASEKNSKTKKNRRWTSGLVLEEIRKWHEEGKPLYSHYIRNHYQELLAAGIRYYGTWQSAVQESGLSYSEVRKYQEWSRETIIATIRELKSKGNELSFRSMMGSPHQAMVYAAIRPNHFGSWKAALEASGINSQEVYRYRSWDKETIIHEIKTLQEQGADLSSKAMDQHSNSLIATARRRFGSWEEALKKAGIDYSKIRKRKQWTKEMVEKAIHKLQKQGKPLTSTFVRKNHPALFAAACKKRFFGSWSNAIHSIIENQPVGTPN